MEIIKTKDLSTHQYQQIDKLWNEEYPINLKNRFGKLLEGVENYQHYIIEDDRNTILAWAVYFEKDNEIRFSILVKGTRQKMGLGSMLLARLKEDLGDFYGWVIDHNNDKKEDGEFYQSPLLFYVKHGFEVLQDARIDSEMLNAVKIRMKV